MIDTVKQLVEMMQPGDSFSFPGTYSMGAANEVLEHFGGEEIDTNGWQIDYWTEYMYWKGKVFLLSGCAYTGSLSLSLETTMPDYSRLDEKPLLPKPRVSYDVKVFTEWFHDEYVDQVIQIEENLNYWFETSDTVHFNLEECRNGIYGNILDEVVVKFLEEIGLEQITLHYDR